MKRAHPSDDAVIDLTDSQPPEVRACARGAACYECRPPVCAVPSSRAACSWQAPEHGGRAGDVGFIDLTSSQHAEVCVRARGEAPHFRVPTLSRPRCDASLTPCFLLLTQPVTGVSGVGPSHGVQTPFERAVAMSELVLGRSLALPERRLLRSLPAATCEDIAAGRRTLAAEAEKATHALAAELAVSRAVVPSVDDDAAYARAVAAAEDGDDNEAASIALAHSLAAEQEAEAKEFKARPARLRLDAAPRRAVTTVEQRLRLPTGQAVPAVVWTWKETAEGGAWFAPEVPDAEAVDHLRVVCLSDTHGCHGLLERYWDSHAHVLNNAHLAVLTGDCWEHEGAMPAEHGPSQLDYEDPPVSRNLGEWLLSKYNIKYKTPSLATTTRPSCTPRRRR